MILAILRRLRTQLKLSGKSRYLVHGMDIHTGAHTRLWAPSKLQIGNGVYIGKDVLIEANAEIGDYSLIANRVAFVGRHDHDFSEIGVPVRFSHWIGSRKNASPFAGEKVLVGPDVWIGYGATIHTWVSLGRGSIVAAGAVVVKDVEPYKIVGGNPARVIGTRFDSTEKIEQHEKRLGSGSFRSSERGFDHFIIEPGP